MSRFAAVVPVLILSLWSVPATAQWIKYPSPGTPYTPDGKPDLAGPIPKLRGKPDLSGIWRPGPISVKNLILYSAVSISQGLEFTLQMWSPDAAPIPMQPWAETLYKERQRTFGVGRPSQSCMPHGIPDAMLVDNFKIIQDPGETLVLYEEFARFRQIFTDGRKLPKEMNPAWLGYSIGKWDKDRFVVDTVGFNDRSWLDNAGHPHTEALHTIESYHRVDFGHMDMDFTVDDPKAYTKPWTVTLHFVLAPDTELIEHVCENEKDSRHEVGRVASDERTEFKVAPETLAKYAGSYEFQIPDDAGVQKLEVSVADGHLMFFGAELTAVSETEFAAPGGYLKFAKDAKGNFTLILIRDDGPGPNNLKGVRKER